MDIDSVADELYGLAPEDFVAARNEREKQAKQAGDKDLATLIHALAKPNLVAWLANRLARERTGQLEPLIELGAALRDATATLAGDRLRELSRQQHELVVTLVAEARRLAEESGRKMSDEAARGLQDTLHAALADPRAAAQLMSGRLTVGLQRTGFGFGADVEEPATAPSRAERAVRGSSEKLEAAAPGTSAELEAAVRDLDLARAAADEATQAAADAHSRLDDAEQTADETGLEVQRLAAELDRLVAARSVAEDDRNRLRESVDQADRAAGDAQRRLDDAVERHERLMQGSTG